MTILRSLRWGEEGGAEEGDGKLVSEQVSDQEPIPHCRHRMFTLASVKTADLHLVYRVHFEPGLSLQTYVWDLTPIRGT